MLAAATCACSGARLTREQDWVVTKFRECQSLTNAINVRLDRVEPDGRYHVSMAQTQTEYNRLAECMKDDEVSLRVYRREAAAGTAWAMTGLGYLHETGGAGLAKDDAEAAAWYRRGTEAGDGVAMSNLGNLYMSGRGGLPRDDAEGARWYRRGADLGEPVGDVPDGLGPRARAWRGERSRRRRRLVPQGRRPRLPAGHRAAQDARRVMARAAPPPGSADLHGVRAAGRRRRLTVVAPGTKIGP